jgi:Peptidase family M49
MVYGVSGFTAIVDKQLSAKYEVLVDSAPQLIKVLPWGPDFEVDVFRKPDFTALEVLSFATGGKYYRISYPLVVHYCFFKIGIPAGINVSFPVIACKSYYIAVDSIDTGKCLLNLEGSDIRTFLQNYYDIRESTGFKNVSLAVG